MSEILFIHPGEKARAFGGMPPLGMLWIASYLESMNLRVELVDSQVENRDLTAILDEHKPLVAGIGGTTHTRYESFRIAREIRKYSRDTFILYGGPHATFTAEDTLQNVPEIDMVVRGEGELSSHRVIERVLESRSDFHDIGGISYRDNGGFRHNPAADRVDPLDILPSPGRDPGEAVKYDLKMDFLGIPGSSVITSRGCPVNCSFCSASAMYGSRLTLRSAESVVDEIERLLKDFGYEGIKIFDSTFTLNRAHVESICEEITRRKLDFPWECETRVGTVNRDLLRMMKDAGCYYVDFGIESASPHVLKKMNKGITIEDAVDLLKWTKELGIRTKVFFTFGHIGETIRDARMTVEFMDRYREYFSRVSPGLGIRIYPGTLVEEYAHSIGCLDKSFSWANPFHEAEAESIGREPHVPILVQPQMGWNELRQVGRLLVKYWLKDPLAAVQALKESLGRGRISRLWTVPKRNIQSFLSD